MDRYTVGLLTIQNIALCRVKSYTLRLNPLIMVEVECPSCGEIVNLGNGEDGTYECPYCQNEFIWRRDDDDLSDEIDFEGDSFNDNVSRQYNTIQDKKVKEFLKMKRSKSDFKFPMEVGNLKARWNFPNLYHGIGLAVGLAVILPIVIVGMPIQFLIWELKRARNKKEYNDGILNPEFLRGTGLVIFQDLSAKLVAKSKIPAYEFEKEDITKIILHEIIYGIVGDSSFELHIYLHDFHALTLYGFNEDDSKDILNKLLSVYDIELEFSYDAYSSSGGDGGSGGGGG